MRTERIEWKTISPVTFSCFLCRAQDATHRVTLNLDHDGHIIVCLCDDCAKMTETELYAHFMGRGK